MRCSNFFRKQPTHIATQVVPPPPHGHRARSGPFLPSRLNGGACYQTSEILPSSIRISTFQNGLDLGRQ